MVKEKGERSDVWCNECDRELAAGESCGEREGGEETPSLLTAQMDVGAGLSGSAGTVTNPSSSGAVYEVM